MARTLRVEIVGDSSSLERALRQAGRSTSGFQRGLTTASKGAAIALGAMGLAGKIAFDELNESTKVAAQTAAVIKSTGGAANVTAGHVDDLSQALLKKSGVDDEVIKSGANVLLTFRRIRNETGAGNDVFDRATKATLDLSVALGKDMSSSAILVGKALNDPVGALGALSRAGIQFTEQQKDQIKTMVAAGDTIGAQKVVLAELTAEFGGSAEAAGKTFGGQLSLAKEEAKNFGAELLRGAIPTLTSLAHGLQSATQFLEEHKTMTKVVIGVVGGLSVAVLSLKAALEVWKAVQIVATAAQWAFNAALTANPIGLVVVALAALGTALVIAYQKSETFRDIVNGAFNVAKTVVISVVSAILTVVDKFLGGLQAVMSAASHLPFVGDKFRGVADQIGEARAAVRGLQGEIDSLHGKTVTITTVMQTVAGGGFGGAYAPGRASGGPVTGGRLYTVGENGPELFRAPMSGEIIPHGKPLSAVGGDGGATTINVYVSGWVGSDQEIANRLRRELTRIGRQNVDIFGGLA